jgi:hypothetical protein
MKSFLKPVVIITVITIIFGTIYGVGQQVLRLTANDPQFAMAEDAAAQLNQGISPGTIVTTKVDLSYSQAPFILIYDKNGKNVASDTYIGRVPLRDIPYGVLTSITSGYHAVTWQPEVNLRLAAVAVKADNYYVVGARSLREVERREEVVMWLSGIGWTACLFVLGIYYGLRRKLQS